VTVSDPAGDAASELRAVASLWWLTVAVGILSVIAGIIVLLKPSNSLTTIAVVVGIFAVVEGIIALVRAIGGDAPGRGLLAVVGILSLIVGVFLIRHPTHGVTAVAVIVGIWLIALGALRFVLLFDTPEHRGWRLLVAIVEIVAGIVIVSSPNIGIATLAILLGITLIINGVALAAAGFVLRGAREDLA
jgi:uncharacterized membrane protein HdeD (DUF308 family)